MNGYICQGFNPLAAAPNKAKINAALAKLKFLVIMDPLATETSEFWRNYGEHNDVDPAQDPDRGVPPADHVLRRGERLAGQFRALAAVALEGRRSARRGAHGSADHGRAVHADARAVRDRRRRLSRSDREAVLALRASRGARLPRSSRREYSGKALKDLADPKDPTKITRKAGEQLAGFAELRDDGSTASRLLDLLRRLGPDRQPHGAAGQLRSDRDRPDAQLGVGLARQPPRALQPRLLRSERQALQSRRAS